MAMAAYSPAGEDEISQAHLLVHALLDEAFVDALVVAAHQDEVVKLPCQPLGFRLTEGLAAGGHIDGVDVLLSHLLADVLPAAEQRVRLEYSAVPAAVGVVVHLVLLIGGVVPNLMALNLDIIPLLGASQNGLIHHITHCLREQGHNVDPH